MPMNHNNEHGMITLSVLLMQSSHSRLYMKNRFLHVWNLVNICDLQATEESSNTLLQLWKYQ